mgnify:CR=1 FL=1
MTATQLLVVDDEQDIRDLIEYNLAKNGFKVKAVATGEEALREAMERPPDCMLLDLMLPGIDGLEIVKRMRFDRRTSHVPIVIISAKGEEADVVVGLELGADDYIPKPFSPRVLLARVKAVLRRREAAQAASAGTVVQHGPLRINIERHEAFIQDREVQLTALEMRILATLARTPGRVYTRYQIVEATQGVGVGVTDRSVDVHIVSLRRKLEDCSWLIETVRGVGYRFAEVED